MLDLLTKPILLSHILLLKILVPLFSVLKLLVILSAPPESLVLPVILSDRTGFPILQP